jgi:hypothetical protein
MVRVAGGAGRVGRRDGQCGEQQEREKQDGPAVPGTTPLVRCRSG